LHSTKGGALFIPIAKARGIRSDNSMTAIFGWLKNFCKRNGIPRIVIQSVETKEMSNWCIKNGFQPDEYASMPIGGFVIGNYLLDCF